MENNPTLETIRAAAIAWGNNHPEWKVMLDEDGMQADVPDAVQISINHPTNEYNWTGFMYSVEHTTFMTDTSDDIDEDERETIEAAADDLIEYIGSHS